MKCEGCRSELIILRWLALLLRPSEKYNTLPTVHVSMLDFIQYQNLLKQDGKDAGNNKIIFMTLNNGGNVRVNGMDEQGRDIYPFIPIPL